MCMHIHIRIGACTGGRGRCFPAHPSFVTVCHSILNSKNHCHIQDFYSKFEYSEIGHFKGVLIIYSYLCYTLPIIHQNSVKPL